MGDEVLGLRFRKSLKLMPGVRINFGLRGISATVGVRGASINVGARGTYLNTGIPGTGLSARTRLDGPPTRRTPGAPGAIPDQPGQNEQPPPQEYQYKSAPIEQIGSKSLDRFLNLVVESKLRRTTISKRKSKAVNSHRKADQYLQSFLLPLRQRISPAHVAKVSTYRDELGEYTEDLSAAYEANILQVDFNLSPETQYLHESLLLAFDGLRKCRIVWDITSGRRVDRVRERSAASEAVERSEVSLTLADDDLLGGRNMVPVLRNANGADLYIYPAFLMARLSDESFSLIDLRTIQVSQSQTRFAEMNHIPSDAKVVGHTWLKANKDGSPDRRFSDNRQIPLALYQELTLSTANGLLEQWMFSNQASGAQFISALQSYLASLPKGEQALSGNAPPEISELPPLELPETPIPPGTDWRGVLATFVILVVLSGAGYVSGLWREPLAKAQAYMINAGHDRQVVTNALPPSTAKLVEAPTTPPEPRPLTSDDLVEIQTYLKSQGLYRSKIDGRMGPGTKAGIEAFLKTKGASLDYANDSRLMGLIKKP